MKTSINRRSFLKTSAAVGALAVAGYQAAGSEKRLPVSVTTPRRGPNEELRIACVGIKGRGTAHIQAHAKGPNTRVVTLCDVDERLYDSRIKMVTDLGKPAPKTEFDMRKVFDDKDVDAVSFATPNFWHSLGAIWAMQAGKDIYVEKPCSHNIFEGRKLVETAAKYKRVTQVGTQNRANPIFHEAMKLLREGVIGDVYMARSLCFKRRDSIGVKPDEPAPPPGVHYDLWLGPAPVRPFNENRFHYVWHWNWDYGNGDIGNQGVHEMDIARWALGVELPTRIESMGGRFMWDDDKTVPNTQIASFFYPDQNKMLVFEVRHWLGPKESELNVGVLVFGSKGYMALDARGYRVYLGGSDKPEMQKRDAGLGAWPDFIKAMKSRKISDLSADVEQAHLSAAHCHLANIAYRVGRAIEFDPKSETIKSDKDASALLTRNYRAPYVVPGNL